MPHGVISPAVCCRGMDGVIFLLLSLYDKWKILVISSHFRLLFLLLRNYSADPSFWICHVPRILGDDMDMQVHYRLTCRYTVVYPDIIPVRRMQHRSSSWFYNLVFRWGMNLTEYLLYSFSFYSLGAYTMPGVMNHFIPVEVTYLGIKNP